MKRKDENTAVNEVDGAAVDEGTRVKRLSAGPGSVNVRDSVRSMEMMT